MRARLRASRKRIAHDSIGGLRPIGRDHGMSRRRILRADESSARALDAASRALSAIPVTNPPFSSGEISRCRVRLTHNFHRSHVRARPPCIVSHTRGRPPSRTRVATRCVCPPRCDALRRNVVNLRPPRRSERTVVVRSSRRRQCREPPRFPSTGRSRRANGRGKCFKRRITVTISQLAMFALTSRLGQREENNWKVGALILVR